MACILRDNEIRQSLGPICNGYQSQTFMDIPGSTVGCLCPGFLYCIQRIDTVIALSEETASQMSAIMYGLYGTGVCCCR